MKKLFVFSLLAMVLNSYGQLFVRATGQVWSNNAWVNNFRETNTVDGSGYLVNNMYEAWTPTASAWRPSGQSTYTNNAAGAVLQVFSQGWEIANNTWVTTSIQQNTVNGNNKCTVTLIKNLNGGGTFVNSRMTSYSYDAKGYLISELTSSWQSGVWTQSSRATYTNTSNGLPTQVLYESFFTGSWKNDILINYSYVSGDKEPDILLRSWNGSVWENDYKTSSGYDIFGFLISQEDFNWVNGAWVQASRITVTNYPDGKINYWVSENPNGSQWQNSQKVTYQWDPLGPVGIAEHSDGQLPTAIYFDFDGNRVEKQTDKILIEQRGNVRRKVFIQE